jgi:hypothetical protein
MHVPVPLVIDTRPPAFVREPLAENATGNPDVLSAETVNAVLYAAVAGADEQTDEPHAGEPTAIAPAKKFALAADFRRRVPLIEQAPAQ